MARSERTDKIMDEIQAAARHMNAACEWTEPADDWQEVAEDARKRLDALWDLVSRVVAKGGQHGSRR